MFIGLANSKRLVLLGVLLVSLCITVLVDANEDLPAAPIVWQENSQEYQLVLRELEQLSGVIWAQSWLDETNLLVTLRKGRLLCLTFDTNLEHIVRTQTIDLPIQVWSKGQAGLLDIVKGPKQWFYLTYVEALKGQGVTSLARTQFVVDESDNIHQKNWEKLLTSDASSGTNRHFGSRVAFDTQGHLYMSIGDRGVRSNGQDLSNQAAAILRLSLDGGIPSNNPFVAQTKVNSAIFSYGHRNPQGLAFDLRFKRLWAIEHGPRGGDELNLIQAGSNYGWPTTSHGKEYWGPVAVGESETAEGIESPIKIYTPSIAPGSLMVYQSHVFEQWAGDLFSGALKLQHLNRIVMDEQGFPISEERLLNGFGQRIRSVSTGPKGFIYIGTDSGGLYKLSPQGRL
ncbi:PQQ-dependent sugar dehydrogenase [Alginatibacterium sediminis]|nr:PQQ-dependent sugar dehydrogenase [Alginatibacterium sediminis]